MKTFMVKYIKENKLKIAYVQGVNQLEAQEKFLKDFSLEKGNIIEVTNLKGIKNDYGTAIFVAKFISFIGWLGLIIGISLFVTGTFMLVGISATIGIITSSFMMIMGGQITRATADSANYSKQMLEESRYKK